MTAGELRQRYQEMGVDEARSRTPAGRDPADQSDCARSARQSSSTSTSITATMRDHSMAK
jgi:hypothetical protein